jgi:hypothetical protein
MRRDGVTIPVASEKHDPFIANAAKGERTGWLAIRGSHYTPVRYFKAAKLGHTGTADNCEHFFQLRMLRFLTGTG